MRVHSGFLPNQTGMDARGEDRLDPCGVSPHHYHDIALPGKLMAARPEPRRFLSRWPSRQGRDAARGVSARLNGADDGRSRLL